MASSAVCRVHFKFSDELWRAFERRSMKFSTLPVSDIACNSSRRRKIMDNEILYLIVI